MPKALLVAATLALATSAMAVGTGCNFRPLSTRPAAEADLPSDFRTKANLAPDARIVGVTEQTYSKGTKMYLIRYEVDGVEREVKYNPKETSTPNGVFEGSPHEPGVRR